MTTRSATEAVKRLAAAVDALLDADLSTPTAIELAQAYTAVEVQRRRLDSADHALVAALDDRRLAGDFGRTSTTDLLVGLARVSPGEAKARVSAAADLGPRRELGGAPLEPLLARVAEAERLGEISSAHSRVIRRCLDDIPLHLAVEASGPAEAFLVEQARMLDPRLLSHVARRLLATVDPDGAPPRDADQQRHRGVDVVRDARGYWILRGKLTDECATTFLAAIDPLSAPQPSEDGVGDDRTPAQRRHDALLDLSQRVLRSGSLPDSGGVPVTVTATATVDDLLARNGTATTACGGLLSMASLLELAGECELVTTVFDRHGAVLSAGRSRRLASPTQRRVLAARDGGCSFPGCTRPPSWTQAHHVVPWIEGGRTDIDNLTLLCGWHHREFARRGWAVRMTAGVPYWTPPAWLDPRRRRRRNTAHHLPRIVFHDPTTEREPAAPWLSVAAALRRRYGDGMYSTRVRRVVRAPRAAVYRALLDPVAVARWRVPDGMSSEVHEFEPVEGGRFRISLSYDDPGIAGKSGGHTDTFHGTFTRLLTDEQVVEAIEFETDDAAMRTPMTMTTTLRDHPDGTEVELVHDGIPDAVPRTDTGTRMALAALAAWVER